MRCSRTLDSPLRSLRKSPAFSCAAIATIALGIGATTAITTVAGNGRVGFSGDGGPATSALLSLGHLHSGIALDSGGALYITEDFGGVRKVDRNGIITTVAGNGIEGFGGDGGPGIAARLNSPVGLAVTSDGTLFISDWGNQRVRMVVDRR